MQVGVLDFIHIIDPEITELAAVITTELSPAIRPHFDISGSILWVSLPKLFSFSMTYQGFIYLSDPQITGLLELHFSFHSGSVRVVVLFLDLLHQAQRI